MPNPSVEQASNGKPGLNLLLVGPPGAGKGSLAANLAPLNLEHVSSGEFFRMEVARKTPLGRSFARLLEKGEFIPDELTLEMMRKWYFARKKSQGFLLDGFPRNLLQAEVFDEWLELRREKLDACLYLDLSREDALLRISQRRVCPVDGTVFHLTFHPPAVDGICDRCQTPLIQRSDDTEETVLQRWQIFEENTLPLVSYYSDRGILLRVDASQPIDQVAEEAFRMLSGLSLT